VERFDTSGERGWDIDIRRWDLGKRFTVFHVRDEVLCIESTLNGTIPTINFANYQYNGKVTIDGVPTYEFDAPSSGALFTKYFQNTNTNDPVRLESSGPSDETLTFFEFDAGTQELSLFNVSDVAPGVTCKVQPNNFGSMWTKLDAKTFKKGHYYSPPLMTAATNITGGGCQTGQASWYSCSGSGACAACDPSEYMAAHLTIPCGTSVTVTDTDNGRSVNVKIEDRGPYVPGRIVDVNYAPAEALDMISAGVVNARVCY